MKKTFLLVLGICLATSYCFAEDGGPVAKKDGENFGKHFRKMGMCRLHLSEEQQANMRTEKFKFEESRIDLEAQLKHAKLAYKQVLSDPNASYDEAKAAAKEVARHLSNLISAKEDFKAEVAFKIFSADQRKEAMKCHHHRHHFGRRPHFGPRPDHRMGLEEAPAMPQQEGAELAWLDSEE